jgi:two-component system response regulator NreC
MQYSEIASKLFISTHTIEKHKQNISRKLGIHSREGLMLFAIQNDLINTSAIQL